MTGAIDSIRRYPEHPSSIGWCAFLFFICFTQVASSFTFQNVNVHTSTKPSNLFRSWSMQSQSSSSFGLPTTDKQLKWKKQDTIVCSSTKQPTDEEDDEESSDTTSPVIQSSIRSGGANLAASPGSAPCVIKVLGVGGGGGNAVNHMIENKIEGVSFWAINTDSQALATSLAPNRLNIGKKLTRGLGAGGHAVEGAKAALENVSELKQICAGADMVFITAGMGGGTGSGAAPILAEIAKEDCGCLTVGVVTKPFAFEGRKRMEQAELAIAELRKAVDTLIVVSNDKLLEIVPENTPVTDAFIVADDILRQGIVGISEIILKTGLVNVDFADVRAVMQNAGTALIGVGKGTGRNRASDAAIAAISSPLLEFPIHKARRIVFNIVGGEDMGLQEINEASEVIYENADDNANIIFGALVDPTVTKGEISITVLACDFDTVITSPKVSSSAASFTRPKRQVPNTANGLDSIQASTSYDDKNIVQSNEAIEPIIQTKVEVEDKNGNNVSAPFATGTGGFKRPQSSTAKKLNKRQRLQDFLSRFLKQE